MVLVLFIVALTLWSRHLGLFTSFSEISSESLTRTSSASESNLFSYGAVKVEKVLDYQGARNKPFSKSEDDGRLHSDERTGYQSQEQRSAETTQKPADPISEQDIDSSDIPKYSSFSVKAKHTEISQSSIEDVQQTQAPDETEDGVGTSDEDQKRNLRKLLDFSERTAINFMHFHKTGGVSFKTSLHKFYNAKWKGNGNPVIARDACYVREGVSSDRSQPSFKVWRCDWQPIRDMNEEDRNKHDFVFGHQFWGKGISELLKNRDLQTFTILRHPFARKVSFYYHFFVREVGRKEEDVSFDEIRDFLLHDKLVIDADLGRDLGPNYMAGRLLSDGKEGFIGNSSYSFYAVDQDKKQSVADQAIKLIRKYVFVGLQEQSAASQCMLRKVVEAFNEVNGVNNDGAEKIDEKVDRLNRGSYSLSAKDIWSRFSPEDRALFERKEKVDILIYSEGERLFHENVKSFGCSHRLVDSE